jgi:hypothetical protein
MIPKERAKQLVESMLFSCRECDYEVKAKKCALILVDEILAIYYDDTESMWANQLSYWHQIKQEIELL